MLPVQTIQAFSLTVTRGVYFPTTALPAAVAGQAYSAQVPAGGSFTPFQFAAPAGSGYALTTVPSTFTTAGTLQPWRTDETEWDLDLGFAFPFFGTPFTRCRVGDDGYLVFGTASPDPYWDATPEQFGDLQIIAPFWTDLVISDAYPDTGIWVERGANAITVRWRGRDYHVPTDVIEFAVTLSADGRITCSYGSVATSNRVVIGLAAGSAGMKQLIFSHAWDGTTSDTVTEWSGHADLCFLWPKALPGWLHVTAAGTLSGTPPTAGSWVFTLQATDTAANVAVADFTLVVNDLPTADTNQDGHVDNREILAFAERWAAETVPETLLRAEIERWRTGGTARAAAPAAVLGAAPAAPRPRLGEILVADVPLRDAADAGRLTAAGYDVAGAQDGHATVYGTPDEIEQLRRDGYAPVVTESQWVGEAGPRRRSANRTASGYTTYDALTTALQDAAARYPQLCRLVSLGTSVQGRDLWAVRISAVPEAGALPSEVRFVGGMHGDEPLGGEVCLRLLSWLLGEYGGPSAEAGRITKLLDATAIWIVPSANPDGLVAGTRYNVNGLDLNRAFPDRTVADIGNAGLEGAAPIRDREPEVAALMEWSRAHRFALSLQLHTGSLVVAYPYGSRDANAAGSSLTADDALFHALALAYAALNPTMRDQSPFADGVVNAATWYPTTGEMADWSYTYLGTLDMTAELSLVRSPLAAQIAQVWDANREALLTHAETARRGVFGTVTDSITHAPLRAEIRPASGGQAALTHLDGGTYQRVLAPGYQTLEVSAPGYWTATPEISVDAAPAVSPFAVELLPAPHLAARSLPMPDPGAGQPLTVRLDWRAADAHALHAFILTEVLPRDTTYIPGSAVDYDARPLDAPRIGNGRCSWLFWGRQLHDGQVSYQVLPPPAAERLHFQGVMETATGTIASTGATLWSAPEEFRFHLQTGWNMISLPVEPDPADAGTIFAALRGAQLWRWTGVVYELAPSLRAGQGYWIYAKGPGEFVVRGPPPVECWADLHPGWNLVGALTDRRLRANDSVPGPCWSWDGRQYQVATQLVTGQAYWVYTATATRIRLAP